MDSPLKVFVYWNLHKKCYSVKALNGREKGRVVAHLRSVLLVLAEFRVSQAGRQRVLREKRKNVHAGVAGYMWSEGVPPSLRSSPKYEKITYNPYKFKTFMGITPDGMFPVHESNLAELSIVAEKPHIVAY